MNLKKNLNKHLLMRLLIMLITVMSLNGQNKSLNQNSDAELKKSKISFSKYEVEQLISEITLESEKQIDLAYNEGYKAATVFYAPKLRALEIKNEALSSELEKEKRKKWLIPVCSVAGAGLGFCGGLITIRLVQ